MGNIYQKSQKERTKGYSKNQKSKVGRNSPKKTRKNQKVEHSFKKHLPSLQETNILTILGEIGGKKGLLILGKDWHFREKRIIIMHHILIEMGGRQGTRGMELIIKGVKKSRI